MAESEGHDLLDKIVEQIKRFNDISDDAIDRAIANYDPLPRDLEYMRIIPNAFWFQWRELTERERAFLISGTRHAYWLGTHRED
jgi:hypothetical protein